MKTRAFARFWGAITRSGRIGRNTEIQGENLVATTSGRALLNGDRIDVVPVYEVPRDLDYSVGNIEFGGDVMVRGDVKPGFSIVAEGSVVVQGMTERASIRAEGDITLMGVSGGGDTEIECGGNLAARYLQAVIAKVAGDLKVNSEIINCDIRARRVVTSPAGRIVGGTVTAETEIVTGTLGSAATTPTQVTVASKSRLTTRVIRARERVHPGVKVQIGVATLEVEDELLASSFWELQGAIVRLDPSASISDLEQLRDDVEPSSDGGAAA